MPVDIIPLHKKHGLSLCCRGKLKGNELIDAIESVPALEYFNNLKYVLIDETQVETFDIATSEIVAIASLSKKVAGLGQPKTKVIAFVVPQLLGYGLARMWEVLASETNWITKVFKIKDEAEAWVKEQMKEQFEVDLDEIK